MAAVDICFHLVDTLEHVIGRKVAEHRSLYLSSGCAESFCTIVIAVGTGENRNIHDRMFYSLTRINHRRIRFHLTYSFRHQCFMFGRYSGSINLCKTTETCTLQFVQAHLFAIYSNHAIGCLAEVFSVAITQILIGSNENRAVVIRKEVGLRHLN